jgi:hypothetical protein
MNRMSKPTGPRSFGPLVITLALVCSAVAAIAVGRSSASHAAVAVAGVGSADRGPALAARTQIAGAGAGDDVLEASQPRFVADAFVAAPERPAAEPVIAPAPTAAPGVVPTPAPVPVPLGTPAAPPSPAPTRAPAATVFPATCPVNWFCYPRLGVAGPIIPYADCSGSTDVGTSIRSYTCLSERYLMGHAYTSFGLVRQWVSGDVVYAYGKAFTVTGAITQSACSAPTFPLAPLSLQTSLTSNSCGQVLVVQAR